MTKILGIIAGFIISILSLYLKFRIQRSKENQEKLKVIEAENKRVNDALKEFHEINETYDDNFYEIHHGVSDDRASELLSQGAGRTKNPNPKVTKVRKSHS